MKSCKKLMIRGLFVFLILAGLIFTGCSRQQDSTDGSPGETELTWSDWIKANNNPILSLTSEDFADLEFLKPLLQGKRIVQLGESGHGVKEFNEVKVRLIKFLHQEVGFDIIAFESSIFECFLTNRNISLMNAEEMIRNSIFPVWHTKEVILLFEYLKETYSSKPLILAGFDTQISASSGVENRPLFLKNVISKVDPTYAEEVYNLDYDFISRYFSNYNSWQNYIKENKESLIKEYEHIVSFFDKHKKELSQVYPGEPEVPLIARQASWSMIQFIDQMYYDDFNNSVPIRDKGMADNVEWLLNEVYPGKRIIIWAHNFHIRHNNAKTSSKVDTMGKWIAERHHDELYTIGLYMFQGEAAQNNRSVYTINPAPDVGYLSYILSLSGQEYCFVDLENQLKDNGNSWMFQNIIARSWGTNRITMIIRDQYSGIIFINTTHAPDYLPW